MKEQLQKFHRTTSKETISWWKSQSDEVKQVSLFPLATDMHLVDGLLKIKDYVDSHEGERIVWVRGTLDQITFNSLCKSAGVAPIFPFKNYMEVRTAINLLKDSAKRGYCSVPNFDFSIVKKHNPIHDISYDVMQILYGE